jgi:cellulose synthase/poly-beta-1,6-N-acetylglucosamine synthase-like glycosyltransferase
MEVTTNEQLAALPITLLQPTFENSSKAKALQYAISSISHQPLAIYDFVVILDADNIVAPHFLSRLSQIARPDIAIQCHRTAKNANNDIAALDGLSEEINNSIFRRGHNRIGMSSALIGSGMCFAYRWFKGNVTKLNTAVEDRELEALLMKQGIYIHYTEDIHVFDEKVSNSDNFQHQRLRWMTGQVQALFQMLPYIPKATITGNINYIDKTIQQALIPRSILLVLTPTLCIIATLTSYIIHHTSYIYSLKWWFLFISLCIALFLAIPKHMHRRTLLNKLMSLPTLVWKMILNIIKIDHRNNEFIHTTHGK